MKQKIMGGILGGLAGGVAFGIIMAMMGMIAMIAKLVGSDSTAVGWLVHLAISIVIGLFFVWWFGGRVISHGSGASFGLLHGFIWWILGPLLVMPILLGMGPQFGSMFAKINVLSLMGHLVYGLILGFVYAAVTFRQSGTK